MGKCSFGKKFLKRQSPTLNGVKHLHIACRKKMNILKIMIEASI